MSSNGAKLGGSGVGEHGVVDGLGEVAFQAAAGLGRALVFGPFAVEVGASVGVPSGLDHGHGEEGAVELTVASSVEPVPGGLAAGGGHGCGAGVGGEGGGGREAFNAAGLAEDLGGHDGADTAHVEESGRLAGVDGGGDVVFQIAGVSFELVEAADGGQGQLGPHRFGRSALDDQASSGG